MSTEQIKELIEKAEKAAFMYGGTWHISSEYQLLPDCYFFDEKGLPKEKPYYSLYNTTEKIYREGNIKIVEGQTWQILKIA